MQHSKVKEEFSINNPVRQPIMMHHAFTMIELIFAIVIVGVTILTIPLMLVTNATNQDRSLIQEGVMITSTKISQVLTYPWDVQSSPTGTLMSTSQVLDTLNTPLGLERNATTDFRIGHFRQALRRRMTPNSFPRTATNIGAFTTPQTSIAHFNGAADAVETSAGTPTTATGYKKEYQLRTIVSYINDNATYSGTTINFNYDINTSSATSRTNIKMVQVITDEVNASGAATPIVSLVSFSSNIGETEFYKRRY